MSVISYAYDEIVMAIAASWNLGSIGSSDAARHLDYLAEAGNRIQAANAAAYEATYSDPVEIIPIAARMIKNAIVGQTIDKKLQGRRVLSGIRYNLVANNGKDFATAEILDDLLMMVSAQWAMSENRAAA